MEKALSSCALIVLEVLDSIFDEGEVNNTVSTQMVWEECYHFRHFNTQNQAWLILQAEFKELRRE